MPGHTPGALHRDPKSKNRSRSLPSASDVGSALGVTRDGARRTYEDRRYSAEVRSALHVRRTSGRNSTVSFDMRRIPESPGESRSPESTKVELTPTPTASNATAAERRQYITALLDKSLAEVKKMQKEKRLSPTVHKELAAIAADLKQDEERLPNLSADQLDGEVEASKKAAEDLNEYLEKAGAALRIDRGAGLTSAGFASSTTRSEGPVIIELDHQSTPSRVL